MGSTGDEDARGQKKYPRGEYFVLDGSLACLRVFGVKVLIARVFVV